MTTVLIVEDHLGIQELYALYLEAAGYTVRVAGTGMSAIQECLRACPDVMLLDVRLPDISGLEVLQYLQNIGLHVSTIVVSGHLDASLRANAARLGALVCLEKPFLLEDLHGALRRVIEVHRSHDVLAMACRRDD